MLNVQAVDLFEDKVQCHYEKEKIASKNNLKLELIILFDVFLNYIFLTLYKYVFCPFSFKLN